MPSVTFTPNVPLSTQKINATQQTINNNFLCLDNNVNGFTVDHQTMTDTSNGGKHLQVSFFGNNVPGSTPSGQNSILYTNAGTADAAHPQVFWKNANSIYHMSAIRAWAYCLSGGGFGASQKFNIANNTRSGTGSYSVDISAGATSSANYAVVISPRLSNAGGFQVCADWVINSTTNISVFIGTFTLSGGNVVRSLQDADFAIMILQL